MAVLIDGVRVLLREFQPSDLDVYLLWMENEGIWKRYDAPWESQPEWSDHTRQIHLDRFIAYCSDRASPRKRAGIVLREGGGLIGWVNRYTVDHHPDTCMVGIDICMDDMLGKGYGTEALGLWVDYLFTHSDYHRIGLATYSFNSAMQRAAEKVGFVLEGRDREIPLWEGAWVDRLTYGLLRDEWLKKRGATSSSHT